MVAKGTAIFTHPQDLLKYLVSIYLDRIGDSLGGLSNNAEWMEDVIGWLIAYVD